MATNTSISTERFEEGMTIKEFVKSMSKNRELFEENYDNFVVKKEDAAFLRGLDRKLKIVVLAEDWCSDVLRYVPVFARMAEAANEFAERRSWDVRVFCRDENLELADLWLKEGKFRAIPVIAFLDEKMGEIACYVEKPAAVYTEDKRAVEAFIKEHSDLPDAQLPTSQMSEQTYELYANFIRQFRADNKARWQQWFVDEIREKLERATYSTSATNHIVSQQGL
ncbi:MAG: thioredoxin family protein [Chloroflexia bacterium]